MDKNSDLTDELGEGDGVKPKKPKDPHYSDKGSHGERHDDTQTKRKIEKYLRKQKRKNDRGR